MAHLLIHEFLQPLPSSSSGAALKHAVQSLRRKAIPIDLRPPKLWLFHQAMPWQPGVSLARHAFNLQIDKDVPS